VECVDTVTEVSGHVVGDEEEVFEFIAREVCDVEKIAILEVQAKPLKRELAIR